MGEKMERGEEKRRGEREEKEEKKKKEEEKEKKEEEKKREEEEIMKEEEENEEERERREAEEKLKNRLKWGYMQLHEVRQLYEEVLVKGIKGLTARIDISNLLLTAEVHLPENSGKVNLVIAYTEDGLKLISYTVDVKDLLMVYSSAGGTVIVKDQYDTWLGTNAEEPASTSIDCKGFVAHLLITLAHHAFSNSDIPAHIADKHLWILAELERKMFPLSS